mgnify:CR=1 FL=1
MRSLFVIVLLALLLSSCEKAPDFLSNNDKITEQGNFLEDYWITAIAFAPDGSYWFGTMEQGLIHLQENEITIYDGSNSDFPDSAWIHDIEIDTRGNVWIAYNGISVFDGTTFTSIDDSNSSIEGQNIYKIRIDSKGKLWMASHQNLYEGDGLNTAITLDPYFEGEKNIPSEMIHSIAIDNDDNVWLAMSTYVNEASLVKVMNDTWEEYDKDDLGFSPYWIKDIACDSRNWVYGVIDYSLSSAMRSGEPLAFCYDGNTTETFVLPDTVENVVISQGIRMDSYDRAWIYGFHSINILSEGDWIFNYRSEEDINIFTLELLSPDVAWLGTDQGVIVFRLD